MKKFLLISFSIVTILFSAQAQRIQLRTYVEQTHVSPKIGTAVGYLFAGEIEVGGFYQKSTVELQAENGRPLQGENEFLGAFFAYPMWSTRTTDLKLNIRTGVSNGENFVITPSFQFDYKPIDRIRFGAGIGTRCFRPTYMATLAIGLTR